MTDLREAKIAKIADYIPEQEVYGNADGGKVLVVGWGGTYGHLYSAVKELREEGKDVSLAHFNYINPLPKNTMDIFSKYEKIIVCELNLGQFANYLRSKCQNINFYQCNKVAGLPFTVIELKEKISELFNS
jgi:2-oxoglutarate ferredoxin oxidoreductase subunit alpha